MVRSDLKGIERELIGVNSGYKVVCQSSYMAVLLADTAKPYSVRPYHCNWALFTCQFYSIVFDSPVKVKHLGSTRMSSCNTCVTIESTSHVSLSNCKAQIT